ncbi:MAG: hypothetical protein AB7N91_10360 [Candidatus Tectimicrobiota bacterium]
MPRLVGVAQVHARRVGKEPCRLFVGLLQAQRWEVITQEDEDQAHAMLGAHRDGPLRRHTAEGATSIPDVALSDDARFALLAAQVLRQAGWQGEVFLGVKLHDPTWTRERWEQAQVALAQWQRQQAQARGQRSGLEPLADAPWEEREAQDD